jgi:hypothetical protein
MDFPRARLTSMVLAIPSPGLQSPAMAGVAEVVVERQKSVATSAVIFRFMVIDSRRKEFWIHRLCDPIPRG